MEHPVSTMVPPVTDVIVTKTEMETGPKVDNEVAQSLFSFIILIALMWAISSAALADKRHIAIRAIVQTISSQKTKENN
jgi:hypothetical protein